MRLWREKSETRMKLEKKTDGFKSQEAGGMRREELKKLHSDGETECRERLEVLNKREKPKKCFDLGCAM